MPVRLNIMMEDAVYKRLKQQVPPKRMSLSSTKLFGRSFGRTKRSSTLPTKQPAWRRGGTLCLKIGLWPKQKDGPNESLATTSPAELSAVEAAILITLGFQP